MKRPAFQFYPDNWRNNANLRRCSWAARGVWIEVMCLMHDSDRYGVLDWPLKEIAQALGCPISALRELAEKVVLKGCDKGTCEAFSYTPRSGRRDGTPVTLVPPQDGPIWFSSRMVKDEYLREVRGEGSRFKGPSNQAPDHSPKGGIGEAIGATPLGAQSDGSPTPSPPLGKKEPPLPPVPGGSAVDLLGDPIDPPAAPEVDPEEPLWAVLGEWNQTKHDDAPAVKEIGDDLRRRRTGDLLARAGSLVLVRRYFAHIAKQPGLTGQGRNSEFVAFYDWCIRPEIVTRLSEEAGLEFSAQPAKRRGAR